LEPPPHPAEFGFAAVPLRELEMDLRSALANAEFELYACQGRLGLRRCSGLWEQLPLDCDRSALVACLPGFSHLR
jgi:hypothetical protein